MCVQSAAGLESGATALLSYANDANDASAVFVLSRTKEELYSWTQVPSQYNLDGASNRPKPEDLVELVVQRHLEGKKAHPSLYVRGAQA